MLFGRAATPAKLASLHWAQGQGGSTPPSNWRLHPRVQQRPRCTAMPAGPHKRTRPRALKLAIASPLPGATYLDPMLPADHAMTAPLPPVPIPANDAQRVDAVRRLEVLDTEAEAEFDDIAWLART